MILKPIVLRNERLSNEERWLKIISEQNKYGKTYEQIVKGFWKYTRHCPNCGKELCETIIGRGRLFDKILFTCVCGYEYGSDGIT